MCVSLCRAEADVCICVLCLSRGVYLCLTEAEGVYLCAVLKQRCVSVHHAEAYVCICVLC